MEKKVSPVNFAKKIKALFGGLLTEAVTIFYGSFSVPSDAPRITSTTSSSTSIHVRWKQPGYINAPLLSYTITIERLNLPDIPKVDM